MTPAAGLERRVKGAPAERREHDRPLAPTILRRRGFAVKGAGAGAVSRSVEGQSSATRLDRSDGQT